VLIHAGPFANIAIARTRFISDRLAAQSSSTTRDRVRLRRGHRLREVLNVKLPAQRQRPQRLGPRGHGPRAQDARRRPPGRPGPPAPDAYNKENLELVEEGLREPQPHDRHHQEERHRPVVCINQFHTDTKAEHDLIPADLLGGRGARRGLQPLAVRRRGRGELADVVMEACNEKVELQAALPLTLPLRQRVEMIAKEVYGRTA